MSEWVKMRVTLDKDPEVIHLTRWLLAQAEFKRWLLPGVPDVTAVTVTERCATGLVTNALRHVSGLAQSRGKRVTGTNDVTVKFATLDILDHTAGVPLFGRGLVEIEWAIVQSSPPAITFPNLLKYIRLLDERNTGYGDTKDPTAAERQRRYRANKASKNGSGESKRNSHDRDVTRNAQRNSAREEIGEQERSPVDRSQSTTNTLSPDDWGHVAAMADKVARAIPPLKDNDRRAWIRYAALAKSTFGERWLVSSTQGVTQATNPVDNPRGKFVRILKNEARKLTGIAGPDFDALAKAIEIPSHVWESETAQLPRKK